MTDEPTYAAIPGTNGLPDNPIHRASLWLERVKFGERAFNMPEPKLEAQDAVSHHEIVLRETGLTELSARDVHLAGLYYGGNMRRALFGDRIQLFMPSPAEGHGGKQVNMDELFGGLWADAFEHGLATAKRLYGFSGEEIRDGATEPPADPPTPS